MVNQDELEQSKDKSSAELLAERQRLDELYREKFTREVTVMFTDLKDSTHLAESLGDMQTRELINTHNSLLFPLIEANNGTLVKTMGDGTMSYFDKPDDAIRTGAQFQKALQKHNAKPSVKVPIKVRVGINTGTGIVEESDIYGDVVNVAARFEAQANAGEIYISESSFDGIADKGEFYCRYIKDVSLKGKSEQFKVYKVFWDEQEISADQVEAATTKPAVTEKSQMPWRLILFVFVLVSGVFVVMYVTGQMEDRSNDDKRSRSNKVSMVAPINTPLVELRAIQAV